MRLLTPAWRPKLEAIVGFTPDARRAIQDHSDDTARFTLSRSARTPMRPATSEWYVTFDHPAAVSHQCVDPLHDPRARLHRPYQLNPYQVIMLVTAAG